MRKTAPRSLKKHTFSAFLTLANFHVGRPLKTVLFLLAATGSLWAQSGRISIEQDPAISQLLEIYSEGNAEAQYYTIQVGFGNYSLAERLKSEVEVDFPEYTAKIVFDSPTYRVHIGRFRDRLDAEREYIEVRKKYPAALLLRPGDR